MFAAISGLKSHQTMLDVTANDIANVNTIGYKSARTTFKDSLSQLQRGGAAGNTIQGGANPAQVGLGVQLSSIDNVMTAGTFQSTGNPQDVAIQGEGFFVISPTEAGAGGTWPTGSAAPAGSAPPAGSQYTRAGNFTVNSAGQLVTQDGFFAVGYAVNRNTPPTADTINTSNIAPITIESGGTNLAIGQDGTVSYLDANNNRRLAGQLMLASFPNAGGLQRMSGNRWAGSPASGAGSVGAPLSGSFGPAVSGVVEMSNVDLSQSFTQMITAQRGFQANSRVISASDEMLQDLVNLKR